MRSLFSIFSMTLCPPGRTGRFPAFPGIITIEATKEFTQRPQWHYSKNTFAIFVQHCLCDFEDHAYPGILNTEAQWNLRKGHNAIIHQNTL
jgi:hypothetical protein